MDGSVNSPEGRFPHFLFEPYLSFLSMSLVGMCVGEEGGVSMQGLTRHSLQCHSLPLALAIWSPRHTGVASNSSTRGVGGWEGCGVTAVGAWHPSVLITGGGVHDICAQAYATCEEPSSHHTGPSHSALSR